MKYVEIGARREAYSVDDITGSTLTLGELIDILEDFEDEVGEDTPIILSHDGGYTYGSLHESYISVEETDEEPEEEEEEEIEIDDTFEESFEHRACGEDEEPEYDDDLDEDCPHCDDGYDDDFGNHENSYDIDEAHSFKGLNDRFGGKTLAESLRPRTVKRKKK